MWPFKPKQFLGIDIGSASVKLAELSRKGKQIKLDTYGEFKAASYFDFSRAVGNGRTPLRLVDQQIADIVKLLVRESEAKSKYATFSLPALSTFTTVISVPEMTSRELAQAIPYEAKQYIPLPLSEIILDWHIIGKKTAPLASGAIGATGVTSKTNQLEIFIAAFPKEMVNKFSRISKLAGLELRALELETFSLIRSSAETRSTPIAVLDLGANSSNISIIKNGFIHATHNFDISGSTFTSTLSSALQIDQKRAESIKIQQGLLGRDGEAEISSIIIPLVDMILQESDRVMGGFTRKTNEKISKIVIGGGSANLPGLINRFVEHFGVETVLANPFSKILHPYVLNATLKEIGPDFAIAAGLAMRELI